MHDARRQPAGQVVAFAAMMIDHALRRVRRGLRRFDRKVPRDVELVHQLRVATRRAAATFDLVSPVLPQRDARRWKRRLSRIRRASNEARDLDVAMERFRQVKGHPKLRRLRERRKELQPYLASLAQRWSRHSKWDRQFAQLIERTIAHPERSTLSWQSFTDERLKRRLDRFNRAANRSHDSIDRMHRFRIEVKRLRYLLECIEDVRPGVTHESTLKELEALQDLLGRLNDHEVARQLFRQLRQHHTSAAWQALKEAEKRAWEEDLELWRQEWPRDRLAKLVESLRPRRSRIRGRVQERA